MGSLEGGFYALHDTFASKNEVRVAALLVVNYAINFEGGEAKVLSLMREIDTDSFDYPGQDQPWTTPDSWSKTRRFVLNDFKDILTDASPYRRNGAELQTAGYVMR